MPKQYVINITQAEIKPGRRLRTIWRAFGHEIEESEVNTSIPSRKVRINNLACEAQNPERQTPKHFIDQAVRAICVAHERPFLEIVSSIFDFFFTRSKPTFELAQALIREGRSTQMQPGEPICRTTLNRFPHHQVIG